MSTDWREKEREFLANLKADTGRDLAEWMALIAAQGLPHRNDIIDWLRRQGFMFSRASWLERIHHNDGQPIYLDVGALTGAAADGAPAEARPTPAPPAPAPERAGPPPSDEPRAGDTAVADASPAVPPGLDFSAAGSVPHGDMSAAPEPIDMNSRQTAPPPAARVIATAPVVSPPPAATPEALAETLAKAKAYRPLAQLTLRSIEAALPGLTISAGASHLVLSRPLPFGLLGISGKDIRLALNLGAHPAAAPFEPVRLPVTSARAAGPLTHMIVLTDARQIDAALIALVERAAEFANP